MVFSKKKRIKINYICISFQFYKNFYVISLAKYKIEFIQSITNFSLLSNYLITRIFQRTFVKS
jgi:hypothetical protein